MKFLPYKLFCISVIFINLSFLNLHTSHVKGQTPPSCTVSFNPEIITESNSQFEITIIYDTDMNLSHDPKVTFAWSIEIEQTLTLAKTEWLDIRTCKLTYTTTNIGQQTMNIQVSVSGGISLGGVLQNNYAAPNNFSVDMLEIKPALNLYNISVVDCSLSEFNITVTFNQPMETSDGNIVLFPDVNIPDGFMVFKGSEWNAGKNVFNAYYDIFGNIAASFDDIDIYLGEVKNRYGKTLSGHVFPDAFSIKSVPPAIDITDFTAPTCFGLDNGSITVKASGGTPAYQYRWSLDGVVLTENSDHLANAAAGQYLIKVSGSDECYAIAEMELVSTAAVDLTANILKHVETKDDGRVELTAEGGSLPYTYYVDNISNGTNPTFTNLSVGEHTFKVEDENHCQAISLVEIKDYSAPTAFTPNGDTFNDVFMPGHDIKIFDRNGTLIFHGTDGWDGKYKGTTVRPATYFYIVTFPDQHVRKGTIQVYK